VAAKPAAVGLGPRNETCQEYLSAWVLAERMENHGWRRDSHGVDGGGGKGHHAVFVSSGSELEFMGVRGRV